MIIFKSKLKKVRFLTLLSWSGSYVGSRHLTSTGAECTWAVWPGSVPLSCSCCTNSWHGTSWRAPESCWIGGDASQAASMSASNETSVFHTKRFNSPKHQSWVNFVCPVTTKLMHDAWLFILALARQPFNMNAKTAALCEQSWSRLDWALVGSQVGVLSEIKAVVEVRWWIFTSA